MAGISDLAMRAVEYALGGIAARSDVRSHNVANANTPGYRASTVSFEGLLASAIAQGDPGVAERPQVVVQPGAADEKGNTVSLETEMVGAVKDNLLFETMVQGYTFKVNALRTAIGRRP